jgi:hypothetical protein
MRPVSQRVKKILLSQPDVCSREREGNCQGRITWEHALIFAGRQIDEAFAILKICAFHHEVNEYQGCGGMNKKLHVYLALKRATKEELDAISKAKDYHKLLEQLTKEFEPYGY